MTIRKVGPNSTYPTIAAAVAAAAAGDIIRLEQGYSNERGVVITVQDLTVTGAATSSLIELVLGEGINDVTLDGLSRIQVRDNAGSNIITGNGGGNLVHVSGGADVVHGGDGHDRIEIVYREAMTTVFATAGSVTDGGTNSVTFDGFEDITIVSGSAPDNLTVGDGDHWINPGGGNDTVVAGEGYNQIDTEGGDDHITAESGVVYAGPGNDTIWIEGSNRFGGFVSAGSGNDTVTTGDGDNFAHGEEGDDTITTGGGDDYVTDGSGDDILNTGGGDDSVRIFGGGIDTADGGAGHDLLYLDRWHRRTDVTVGISAGSAVEGYSGLAADATGRHSLSFTGFEQFDIWTGAGDDDVRIGAGNDTVRSGGGDDYVQGGAGNDHLSSSDGADTLSGGDGDDTIWGGGAADILSGGRGDDYLWGGGGSDTLSGGRGADVFVLDDLESTVGASDVIEDLQARDTIDLWLIDANTTSAGDQAFNLVATFSGTAGEASLRYRADRDVTRLILDTDGDANADIVIIATGNHRDFSNFVL
jgi:Ca2+-binding RTX toxin-like protein